MESAWWVYSVDDERCRKLNRLRNNGAFMQLVFSVTKKPKIIKGVVKVEGLIHLFDDGQDVIHSWEGCSGGWGKGNLPLGIYDILHAYKLEDIPSNEAYKGEGYPWFMPIKPLFKTDRTELGIHGKGLFPGTLGCLELVRHDISFFETVGGLVNSGSLRELVAM